MLPLVGVKVVEFTTSIAGFYGGMILADLGAEVIKIEAPEKEGSRDAGSLWHASKFVGFNRNKKSVAIDINSDTGKNVLERLLKTADILLEDLDRNVLNDLGFSYDAVSKINPNIIYASIKDTLEGPYETRNWTEGLIEAESGFMCTTGPPEPVQPLVAEHPPVRLGVPVYQTYSGIMAAMWAMGTLLTRTKTGKGDYLRVGRFEAAVSLIQEWVIDFSAWKLFEKHKSRYYKVKDGGLAYFDHIVRSDKYWAIFAEEVGVSEEVMAETAKLADRSPGYAYGQFSDTVNKILTEDVAAKHTKAEVWELIIKTLVPGGVVNDIQTLVDDDRHIKETKFLVPLTASPDVTLTPEKKTFLTPLLPINSADYNPDTAKNWTPPPKLGEHTVEILTELGYTESEVTNLRKDKVVWP